MKPSLFLLRWARFGLVLFGLVADGRSGAEPHVPQDDRQSLEKLRSVPMGSAARELRELRAALTRDPNNLSLAGRFARLCIEWNRAEADPRYLGRAQAALAPWWNDPKAPVEALMLRATLKQSLHDFTSALADLTLALQTEPGNSQAWLTRATVLTVLGRYKDARQACLHLVGQAPPLIAASMAAGVASLSGSAQSSCALLRQELDVNTSATPHEKLWALTILAESYARLGQCAKAERCYQEALALGLRDVYLLGSYADFLLDEARANEVIKLLRDETRADGLLLRLALAESNVSPPPSRFAEHFEALRGRFEASRLRGDRVHRREEARFTLSLLHQPEQALVLAEENWHVQREPADARIMLQCGLAAKKPAAVQTVLDFLRENRLEDVHLDGLVSKLNPAPNDNFKGM